MLSSFFSRQINRPFCDPGIYLEFDQDGKIYLFDLGDLVSFSSKKILKIDKIFISHTHVDHFYGFDKILRIRLGGKDGIHLYGPPGLACNVESKLAGYNWNIINNFKSNLVFYVSEVYSGYLITREYQSTKYFRLSGEKIKRIYDGVIVSKKKFKISAITLQHRTKSVSFCLKERPIIKILIKKITKIGLTSKMWIGTFKKILLYNNRVEEEIFKNDYLSKTIKFCVIYFVKKYIMISKGSIITYVTDASYDEKNKKNIFKLSNKASHLYIEGVFMFKDSNLAKKKNHLLVKQAGEIAGISNSNKYTIFHFSTRYKKIVYKLKKESSKEFNKKLVYRKI